MTSCETSGSDSRYHIANAGKPIFVGKDAVQVVEDCRQSRLFSSKKTEAYRQIGNAFPPPVTCNVGSQILAALNRLAKPKLMRA
jgi:hypothetical protein